MIYVGLGFWMSESVRCKFEMMKTVTLFSTVDATQV
jgi:hypothetical protein